MNNFKIGDLVEIKSWDEMVNEFGLDEEGYIKCRNLFSDLMSNLCGKRLNILKIDQSNQQVAFDDTETEDWIIGMDMIKHVENN